MLKNEFLSQLSNKLRALPDSEQRDALEYYEGYISDAEDEAAAIRDLGSPGEVAATILSNYVSQRPMAYSSRPPRRGSRIKNAHIAILAIFALPIGLPLAGAALGLIIGLIAVIFTVIVTAAALLIAGIATLIYSPFALANDFWFGLITGGMGLIVLGIGVLAFKGSAKLISGFPAILRMIRKRSHYSQGDVPDTFHDSQNHQWAKSAENIADSPSAFNESITNKGTFDDPQYANSMPKSSQELYDKPFEPRAVKRRTPAFRLAAVLIILGVVMFGLAWHNGARGGSIFWENGRLNVQVGGQGEQAEIPIGESFHSVDIRTTSANVVILPSSTARASYIGINNVDISINSGVLTIIQNAAGTRTFNLMDFDFSSGSRREIRLYIPPRFYENSGDIQVRTTSGRIQAEGSFANFTATSTSGRIEISNNVGRAEDIVVRSTSGRISIDNINHVEHLSAQSTSGRIEVSNIRSDVDTINLRSTSGRLSIENVPYVERLYVSATSGRINLTNISWSNLEARAISGRIEVNRGRIETAPGLIVNTSLTATSGRISMDILNNRDDFRLGLTATSGRITVDGTSLGGRGLINMGSGENIINVRTTSGRISVDFTR